MISDAKTRRRWFGALCPISVIVIRFGGETGLAKVAPAN
jgi:hypothetical protein